MKKMKVKGSGIAQRSLEKIYFDHKDMDYYFSWILGREIYEGSTREECFAVAQLIPSGDVTVWQAEWAKLAQRVENRRRLLSMRATGKLPERRICAPVPIFGRRSSSWARAIRASACMRRRCKPVFKLQFPSLTRR
jgi:hypothetical protein